MSYLHARIEAARREPLVAVSEGSALLAGAIGLLVLVGWYAQLPELTRVAPNFVAMQFNTALALVLSSVSLLGLSRGRGSVTVITALLVLALGGATLVEHISGQSFGIDLLGFQLGVSREAMGWLTEQRQAAPGRMAPNTALSLLLLGFALATSGRGHQGRPVIVALRVTCCLAAAVLGFVAAWGYVLDVPTAYGWGNLTRMAVHTALAISVLGVGATAAVVAAARRGGFDASRWAPLVIGSAGVAISLTLWQALADDQRRRVEHDLHQHANALSNGLKRQLELRGRVATQFAAEWSPSRSDAAAPSRDAARVRVVFADVRVIGWESGGVSQWWGPEAPSHVVQGVLERTRSGGGAQLSAPYVTAGGERLVLIAARSASRVMIGISAQGLVDAGLPVGGASTSAVDVTDGNVVLISRGRSGAAWARAAEARDTIDVLGRRWTTRVRPTAAAIGGVTSGVTTVFLIAALAASVLGALAVGALQRMRTQAISLVDNVHSLAEQRDAVAAANRAKSIFLANMSHELRTPLNAVIGFANVLHKRSTLAELDRKLLSRIQFNGRHLLTLINQVLDLAKIEAGHQDVTLAPASVSAIGRDAVASLEGRAAEAGVMLRFEERGAIPLVATDESKLLQVLLNLIGNALKFTPTGGDVVVRAIGPDSPRLEIMDTGIGIPAERVDAIFEAFEQADAQISPMYGGTGLGLTISRHLCVLMQHSLTVTSEAGRGSTFTVWLAPGIEQSV